MPTHLQRKRPEILNPQAREEPTGLLFPGKTQFGVLCEFKGVLKAKFFFFLN